MCASPSAHGWISARIAVLSFCRLKRKYQNRVKGVEHPLKLLHDPCEFTNDINKINLYLRCPPDSSEYYFQMTAHLKLCGNACVLLLRTPSASQAVGTIPTIETLPSQTGGLHKSVSTVSASMRKLTLPTFL